MIHLNSNITIVLLLFFALGNSNSYSQSSLFSDENYVNPKGDTLQYRQLVSDYDAISKYPLVIFLHGSGERGNDNKAQLKWGVQNFTSKRLMQTHKPIVIAPQCPKNMSWGNFSFKDMSLKSTPTKTMTLLIELINKIKTTMPIDTNRIYITGLSMGGFGTFDAITRHPDLFAAAVPVCGGGDVSSAKKISHIPIWIFHGALDAAVSPDLSQQMYDALKKQGASPGLTIYPDIGHFSWIPAYNDTKLMDWLFKQQK